MTETPTPLQRWFESHPFVPQAAKRFDEHIASRPPHLSEEARRTLWNAVITVLADSQPNASMSGPVTRLVLGRIQSGKTTAITALTALAHDAGYRIIVAVLGSTNLLLDQNRDRLLAGLGIVNTPISDYKWFHIHKPRFDEPTKRRLSQAVEADQTILLTTLKHARQVKTIAGLLQALNIDIPRLMVIDDEADQASLNTRVAQGDESATHSALRDLCDVSSGTLYVQFTATPYAPLLIQADDVLSPERVIFLEPGTGYTGAREFFIDHAATVIRQIPDTEQISNDDRTPPLYLRSALANFFVGAAWLLALDPKNAPVSMLIHASHLTEVHASLECLVDDHVNAWKSSVDVAETLNDLPLELQSEITDLVNTTGEPRPPVGFLASLQRVFQLRSLSVVNSRRQAESITWQSSPAHILIGGNKLDRGFTVEGLTVTYLSRARSNQLDTLYQRGRAFGYRSEYIPFCRFYASGTTLTSFRRGIDTDDSLRQSLIRWTRAGLKVSDWAFSEPLLLEERMRPTRRAVLPPVLVRNLSGWTYPSYPSLIPSDININHSLVEDLEILDAPYFDFGTNSHRVRQSVAIELVSSVVRAWRQAGGTSWPGEDLSNMLNQLAAAGSLKEVPVLLLEAPDGGPRFRSWDPDFGILSLLQGRSTRHLPGSTVHGNAYPGDRHLLGGRTQLQIHRIQIGTHPTREGVSGDKGLPHEIFVPALLIGNDIGIASTWRRLTDGT